MTIYPSPPPGWRRPSIPLSVKLAAMVKRYGAHEFDHRPPVSERPYDDEKNDTIPPANDADHIEALTRQEHDQRSHGLRPGTKRITTAGSDANRRAKERKRVKLRKAGIGLHEPITLAFLQRNMRDTREPHHFAGAARKIKSRGFRKDVTKKFNGDVVPRKRRRS
jgi:hypothetical protein